MKKIVIIIFITAFIAGGCGKSYLNVNQNPNQPTTVGLNVILAAGLQGTANDLANDFVNVTRWDAYWSRSGNYVPDVQTEEYSIPNNYTDPEWTRIYLTLNAYVHMEAQAKATPGSQFYLGVAKLMKSLHFGILVDCYGDVPYSNAFDPLNSVHPKYDKQDAIYADLFVQIDSAIALFDEAKNTIAPQDQAADIVYGSLGDAGEEMDAWVRFANTEELRLLVHQSQVTGQAGFISSQLAKIAGNGRGFIGAGQGAWANPGYTNSTNKISPFYGAFFLVTAPTTNVAYYRANTYSINYFNGLNDPRIGFFYDVISGTSSYGGNFDGDPAAVPNSSTSPVGPGVLKAPTQNAVIFSDFESLFLQAEAAQRGWTADDPKTMYEAAVTQSFVYLYSGVSGAGDPNADAAAYLSQGLAG
ncbi:MAG TPA: SusD/RagB family nutrient-binding outer membrane lipoprotein, partial [Puia sp.]|nr:SusD/RagB family nutrient-binding outer membrane lipoprotein [Puia sp.]